MDFKEFYKLGWAKLIIAIVIIFLPLVLIFQKAGIKDAPSISPFWMYLTFFLFWPFYLMYFVESLYLPKIDWIHPVDIPYIIIAMIINILYLYSLSCLIYLIYRKIKLRT